MSEPLDLLLDIAEHTRTPLCEALGCRLPDAAGELQELLPPSMVWVRDVAPGPDEGDWPDEEAPPRTPESLYVDIGGEG